MLSLYSTVRSYQDVRVKYLCNVKRSEFLGFSFSRGKFSWKRRKKPTKQKDWDNKSLREISLVMIVWLQHSKKTPLRLAKFISDGCRQGLNLSIPRDPTRCAGMHLLSLKHLCPSISLWKSCKSQVIFRLFGGKLIDEKLGVTSPQSLCVLCCFSVCHHY